MKIYQKMLNTLKRALSGKKEIDKELMGIPMKSSKEIWLCPLVSTKVLEDYQERETKRGRATGNEKKNVSYVDLS